MTHIIFSYYILIVQRFSHNWSLRNVYSKIRVTEIKAVQSIADLIYNTAAQHYFQFDLYKNYMFPSRKFFEQTIQYYPTIQHTLSYEPILRIRDLTQTFLAQRSYLFYIIQLLISSFILMDYLYNITFDVRCLVMSIRAQNCTCIKVKYYVAD